MAERTPVTSAVMAMTAAMPITTPRAVSAVRPRLWASARTDSRQTSAGLIAGPLPPPARAAPEAPPCHPRSCPRP